MTNPKIVIDDKIPYIKETISKLTNRAVYIPGNMIGNDDIRDADALIIRTRTHCDARLLTGSNVKFVATATIGYDHINTAYCESHGIRWMSCPGCNAQAVCDYIEEAIDEYIHASTPALPLTIGVVGVGHVGSKVAAMAERKGMKVLLNDPPKGMGISLDKIGRISDIITFHVPLKNSPEEYPTYHLCDEAFLAKCKPGALIINAARGGVVDEEALLRSGHPFILDTWEGEPNINPAALNGAFRASMHIAGYSVEGKRNASQMCLNAIAEQFSLPKIDLSTYPYIGPSAARKNNKNWLADISRTLKAHPKDFEALRKDYPLREG